MHAATGPVLQSSNTTPSSVGISWKVPTNEVDSVLLYEVKYTYNETVVVKNITDTTFEVDSLGLGQNVSITVTAISICGTFGQTITISLSTDEIGEVYGNTYIINIENLIINNNTSNL